MERTMKQFKNVPTYGMVNGVFPLVRKDEMIKEFENLLKSSLKESPCKKCHCNDTCQRPQEHALEDGFYGCHDTDDVKKHNQAITAVLEALKTP